MTQDSSSTPANTPESMCTSCAGIQQNWRRAKGHVELQQHGNRKEERASGQVTVTRYQCDRCGTIWDYENDKQNLHAGWSVVKQG